MRRATANWQESIGDSGMVPEAVLMEEMKPGGETPETQSPTITVSGGMISLGCESDGASIVYQTQQGDSWTDWLLYTKSFDVPENASRLRAKACRLGFRTSAAVERAIERK
jgi:hypothetical protein